MHLPFEGRQRAVAGLRGAICLRRAPAEVSIPVGRQQWRAARAHLDPETTVRRLQEIDDRVRGSGQSSEFGRIQSTASEASELLSDLQAKSFCLTSLEFGSEQLVRDLHHLIGEVSDCWANTLEGTVEAANPTEPVAALINVLWRVAGTESAVTDPWLDAFGIHVTDLVGRDGAVSTGGLSAAFYGRWAHFGQRSAGLFGFIPHRWHDLVKGMSACVVLMRTSDPVLTLRTLFAVLDAIDSCWAEDRERTADVLGELLQGADRSFASHRTIAYLQSAASLTDSADHAGSLMLDVYRRTVESQLAPWAWAAIRLFSGDTGSRPRLAALRSQLAATRDPVLRMIADCIDVDLRNAAAHETFEWVSDAGAVRVGKRTLDAEDLRRLVDRASSVMFGAELGHMLAVDRHPDLATLTRSRADGGAARVHRWRAALEHFGTNGLRLDEVDEVRGSMRIRVRSLNDDSLHPCMQALLWVSAQLEHLNSFEVFVQDASAPTISLDRESLERVWPLWFAGRRWFDAMPTSVFMPLNVAGRRLSELPAETDLAIQWFALDDAHRALGDTGNPERSRRENLVSLSRRLLIVEESLRVCAEIHPDEGVTESRAFRAVRGAAVWARAASQGEPVGDRLASSARRVAQMYSECARPVLFPRPSGT